MARVLQHLFLTCHSEIKRSGPCFLWIEADCVPLKPGWIDQMEGEYKHCGKPFMGCVYQRPFSHLTGCAIYPNNIEQYNPKVTKGGYTSAWDVVNPNLTIAASYHQTVPACLGQPQAQHRPRSRIRPV
jgi:hypothetical protein